MQRFWVGIGSGNAYGVNVTPASVNPMITDLTTVTAVSFSVYGPLDSTPWAVQTWAGSIVVGATPTLMQAIYPFTGTEFTEPGKYRVVTNLYVGAAGPVKCEPGDDVVVVQPWEIGR